MHLNRALDSLTGLNVAVVISHRAHSSRLNIIAVKRTLTEADISGHSSILISVTRHSPGAYNPLFLTLNSAFCSPYWNRRPSSPNFRWQRWGRCITWGICFLTSFRSKDRFRHSRLCICWLLQSATYAACTLIHCAHISDCFTTGVDFHYSIYIHHDILIVISSAAHFFFHAHAHCSHAAHRGVCAYVRICICTHARISSKTVCGSY